jgi:hypothetical protein
MGHNKEDGPEGAENRDYEYLAFELPEFYLRSLKKECIDKGITLNQMIVDLVGNAVKNWPDEPREELKFPYKRVTVKIPKWIYDKLNVRKEDTTMPIRGLVMLIVGLHYVGLDVIQELILGDTLPPLPHMQSSQIAQRSN